MVAGYPSPFESEKNQRKNRANHQKDTRRIKLTKIPHRLKL